MGKWGEMATQEPWIEFLHKKFHSMGRWDMFHKDFTSPKKLEFRWSLEQQKSHPRHPKSSSHTWWGSMSEPRIAEAQEILGGFKHRSSRGIWMSRVASNGSWLRPRIDLISAEIQSPNKNWRNSKNASPKSEGHDCRRANISNFLRSWVQLIWKVKIYKFIL